MNPRRQTLGGLSASQLNARSTAGGAQRVENAKRRNSGVPSSAITPGRKVDNPSRRSSIFGWSSQAQSDPRPLNDKQYLNGCIRSLITYLSTHGYDYPVSPKTLTTPTTKDFFHIIAFLFKKIDPSLKINGKMDEEVQQIFKKLRYPFPISRSALYAVGSPHSWPSLLAALAWLVELLNYEEKAADAQSSIDDGFGGDNSSAAFFDYASKSYTHFLAGDDDQCAGLDDELKASFQEKNGEVGSDVERLHGENAALEEQIAALSSGPSPLEVLERKRSDLSSDISKFDSLIHKLNEHKQSVKAKTTQKQAELDAKRAELREAEAANVETERAISTQAVNKEDVERMALEKMKLEGILAGLVSQREQLTQAAIEDELKAEKNAEGLEAAARAYHSAAERLQLVPSTAKHAEGLDLGLKVDAAGSAGAIVQTDLRGVVKPALNRLKESYIKRARVTAEEILQVQERLDASEEGLTEKTEENMLLENGNKKVEAQTRQLKEQTDEDIAAKAEQVERLRAEVQSLRRATASSLEESEAQSRTLRGEYEELAGACALESEMLNKDLTTALEALIAHKLHIQQTLKRIDEQTKNHIEDLRC